MNTSRTGRQRIINIGITLVTISLCLVSAELIIRKIVPLDKGKSYEFRIPHPALGWTLEPNAAYHNTLPEERVYVKYNSRGFHDIDHSIDKPDGVFRILILGDSFMEAYSVKLKDSFAQRLEEFSRKYKRDVEVINLGTGGYGTLQEYLVFELLGKDYHPDLVLLGFYIENDVVENSRELSSMVDRENKRPFLVSDNTSSWEISEIDYAGSRLRYEEAKKKIDTALYKIASRLILLKLIYEEFERVILKFSNHNGDTSELVNKAQRDLITHGIYYCKEAPEFTRAWDTTERILSRLRDAVEDADGRFAVFSVPSIREIKRRTDKETQGLCMEDPPGYERLGMILRDQGIDYIDLLGDFRTAVRIDGIELFRDSDRHWNPGGHSLAAQRVLSSLIKRGLLDPATKKTFKRTPQ